MRNFIFLAIVLICSPTADANQKIPLPDVAGEAKKVIDTMKEYNPIAGCIEPSMFSSQSPLISSKKMGTCVTGRLKAMELPDSGVVKDKIIELNSDGVNVLNRMKSCWEDIDAMKSCLKQ